MTSRAFQPGFRLDAKDIVVLIVGVAGVAYVAPVDGFLAWIIGFSVGHFFLFCNVFRMARRFELAWATVFVLLSGSTLSTGQPSAAITIAGVLLTTLVVLTLQLRHPSYHGIAWQSVNPGLPQWWDAQAQTLCGTNPESPNDSK